MMIFTPLGTGVVKHIRSVSIRYGALVDSVTLTLSSGEVITAGGNGGGDSSILHIPEGCKVIGFYGGLSHPLPLMKPSLGLGGHVHNFGVVVAIPSILPPPSRPLDPILGNLFQFTSVQQLGSCGMLGGTLFGKVKLLFF